MLAYIDNDAPEGKAQYLLTIDNIPIEEERAEVSELFEGSPSLYISDFNILQQIGNYSLRELRDKFFIIYLRYPFEWENNFDGFHIDTARLNLFRQGIPSIEIDFEYNVPNWKQPWSIREHTEVFKTVFDSYATLDNQHSPYDLDVDVPESPNIKCTILNLDASIKSTLDPLFSIIAKTHEETINILSSRAWPNTLTVQFNFPEEVKVACQQYLLYFIQFLHDIGIEASAELKEEADKVLFSITPENKQEALQNIRTALSIYLHLPSGPSAISTNSLGSDIEVQRLAANIHHLRGQLALASAVIQQKDILIQQQQSTIQQQLLSGQILIHSIQEEKTEEDKEPIIGDIVSIKKYEWQFLELDLPTLLRRLKQLFNTGKR